MAPNYPFIVHKSGEEEHATANDAHAEKPQISRAVASATTSKKMLGDTKHQSSIRRDKVKREPLNWLFFYLVLLPVCTIIAVITTELYWAGEEVLNLPLRIALLVVGGGLFVAVIVRVMKFYKAHEEEQKLLQALFDGSTSARLVTDISEQAIYHNASFRDLCARHSVDAKGVDALFALYALSDLPEEKIKFLIEQAQKGHGDRLEFFANLTNKNGEIVEYWYEIDAQPVAGKAGYVQWRIENITQRHSIENLVHEEREKLLDFMDNAPVGFFSLNEEGRFHFVNETLARWLAQSQDEIVENGRLHGFMMSPPDDAQPYDIVKEGGAKQFIELALKAADDREFLASIAQTVVHEDEGQVITRGVIHDLTAERAIHQALQDSEDRFQKFFEEAPLGILMVDNHGCINDCNPSFARMLGTNVKALEGQDFENLIDLPNRSMVKQTVASIEEGERLQAPIEFKLKIESTDAKDVYVQMFARKFHGKGMMLHFIDLTDQKSLEAQFAQSQKMQAIGQLAGGVAHDFNNLLTAMIGFCDLLILRHKAGDPSFNDIMQIKQNANRAANLVRQLLAFSRQQTLQPRILDISETLTELSHLMTRLLGVGIELKVTHEAGVGLVKADEGQLEQVMVNLAVNARDAMDGQGSLDINVASYSNPNPIKRGADTMPAGEWTTIEFKDTGCGIEKSILERIFEPFFTTKEIGSGTGLGLSTVYGIIRQTGGFVHVDSVVGEGTSFKIYLPEHQGATEEVAIATAKDNIPEKDLTGTATILLVEDEDAVRGFGARALQNKGYEVLEAASAEDALDILETDNPHLDIMVTDVIMPDKDGPTLAREVLADRPDLPVIFVSGFTEDRFKDEFAGYNVSFLPKPFTLKQLAEKVKDTLDTTKNDE
jgi:two-component system cell cycle sensor histidine kinase/response regulator CckA